MVGFVAPAKKLRHPADINKTNRGIAVPASLSILCSGPGWRVGRVRNP